MSNPLAVPTSSCLVVSLPTHETRGLGSEIDSPLSELAESLTFSTLTSHPRLTTKVMASMHDKSLLLPAQLDNERSRSPTLIRLEWAVDVHERSCGEPCAAHLLHKLLLDISKYYLAWATLGT